MRKWIVVAALALAGCSGSRTPERDAVASNAAVMQAALENRARELDAMAKNEADANAAAALEDVADNLADAERNVARAADAAADNLQ